MILNSFHTIIRIKGLPVDYKTAQDIVSRKNQDGTVIIMKMDESNIFYKINGIASEVWDGLSNQLPLATIKNSILENYNVNDSKLDQDIQALISNLLKKKLIEPN
jgi:hypothetical protein